MDGNAFPMCGVIKADAYRTQKLNRFGYITLSAKADSAFFHAGESIRAHEFHYFESTDTGFLHKVVGVIALDHAFFHERIEYGLDEYWANSAEQELKSPDHTLQRASYAWSALPWRIKQFV